MSICTKRCLFLLEKCKNMKQLKQAHGQVITCGLGKNSFALSRLLAFCSNPNLGSPNYGFKIFEQIQEPTICIFNTMIKSFLLKGEVNRTIEIYKNMLSIGMYPDNYTLPYVLKACGQLKSCYLGELVHGTILKFGFLIDTFVGNTLIGFYTGFDNMEAARFVFYEISWKCVVSWTVLISGYAKRGDVYEARLIFEECEVKDRGVWGAMISCYVQNNCFKEGLKLFRQMQITGIGPDEAIFVSVLSACAHLGSLDIGIWIHRYVEKLRMAMSLKLGTALIVMYAKCGCLDIAEKLFDEMPQKDLICWNAMISGFAMNGNGLEALSLFNKMRNCGIRPDDVTFISMFTACSYAGMANEVLNLLNLMCNVYRIDPKGEHYGCIIDVLSRAGLVEEAKNVVQNMPNSSVPSEEAIGWRALLSACGNHGLVDLAEAAAERIVKLERHSGAYVLLSNIYAAAGKHDNARRVRKKMKSEYIDKVPGCSSLEINGVVHEFIAGEKTHTQLVQIHELLETISNNQLDNSVHILHGSDH
ncbi:pentatricopeptide repeat-containing protein At2g20540-like [Lycium ferocissimum]|uniref:pentatricopeptide repeat-containing protein At2g20540-like n=1 Tax=Lycium ferocissimum TaxID=112874 RepID=UPI0028152092|nr:pentatricopeptide repeat-containing protein At2g20540-like [Lycium ferocissimum]